MQKERFVLDAYLGARFIGAPIPHVDPLKEVRASGEKIKLNLSNHEQEMELLGTGEFDSNVNRLSNEVKVLEKSGLNTTSDELTVAEPEDDEDTGDDGELEQS